MKKSWTALCRAESIGAPKFKGQVWLSFEWIVRSYGRDWDNTSAGAKFILDGLLQEKILLNDNMAVIQAPYIHFNRKPIGNETEGVILTISDSPLYQVSLLPDRPVAPAATTKARKSAK